MENKIYIKKPFSESYNLLIDSETKAISLHSISKIKIRWNFQVLEVDEDGFVCNLIKTEHQLLDSNNPIVKEIQQVSSVFGRMYSEIKARFNHKGEIIEVLNNNIILEKWKETKAEMEKHIAGNKDLENSISLNDSIYEDPEKIKIAVQAQEFFTIYFGYYFNEALPIHKKIISSKNLFSTANMQWAFKINSSTPLHDGLENVTIGSKANPASAFSVGFNNAAYGQFKDRLDINLLRPQLNEYSEHQIHYPTGRLLKATIEKQEIAKEKDLYIKLKYTLTADSEKQSKQEKNQDKKMKFWVDDEKVDRTSKGKGFFIDEKPIKN